MHTCMYTDTQTIADHGVLKVDTFLPPQNEPPSLTPTLFLLASVTPFRPLLFLLVVLCESHLA